MKRLIATVGAILMLCCLLVLTAAEAKARACGLRLGEQCGTDTECECLHGDDA